MVSCFALCIDADRVVRTETVQCHDVQHNNAGNQERHQIMQREKPVQGRVVNRETTPQEGHDALANKRNGRKQVGDHGGTL